MGKQLIIKSADFSSHAISDSKAPVVVKWYNKYDFSGIDASLTADTADGRPYVTANFARHCTYLWKSIGVEDMEAIRGKKVNCVGFWISGNNTTATFRLRVGENVIVSIYFNGYNADYPTPTGNTFYIVQFPEFTVDADTSTFPAISHTTGQIANDGTGQSIYSISDTTNKLGSEFKDLEYPLEWVGFGWIT